jgi:hypothetical protein
MPAPTRRAHHGLVKGKEKAQFYWAFEPCPNILPNKTSWNCMKQPPHVPDHSGSVHPLLVTPTDDTGTVPVVDTIMGV